MIQDTMIQVRGDIKQGGTRGESSSFCILSIIRKTILSRKITRQAYTAPNLQAPKPCLLSMSKGGYVKSQTIRASPASFLPIFSALYVYMNLKLPVGALSVNPVTSLINPLNKPLISPNSAPPLLLPRPGAGSCCSHRANKSLTLAPIPLPPLLAPPRLRISRTQSLTAYTMSSIIRLRRAPRKPSSVSKTVSKTRTIMSWLTPSVRKSWTGQQGSAPMVAS